jgi:SAM-dependent methyltransferase
MKNQKNPRIKKFPCIACGEKLQTFKYDGHDRVYNIPGEFKIYKCNNCGLFTIYPYLSSNEVKKYYPNDYFCFLPAIEDEKSTIEFVDRWWGLRKRVNLIQRIAGKKGRVLDVGCATGILLNGLQKKDWDCFGVEPNSKAAVYAKTRFGLNIITGYLEDTNFPDDYFDVVTIFDVLEHLQKPIDFIQEIRRILKADGWLIGTLPNSSSWECKIFGPYWAGWEVPRHYRTFNPKNLQNFFSQYGFKKIKFSNSTGRHGALMMSLNFWLDEWVGPDWVKIFLRKFLGSLPIRIITLPMFLIEERFNRSTIMLFYTQKK